jgi:hypothetical protein
LRLKKCHYYHKSTEEVIESLVTKILSLTGGAPLSKALWFMSGPLYDQYVKNQTNDMESVYFINLKDIAPLRTRSCKHT